MCDLGLSDEQTVTTYYCQKHHRTYLSTMFIYYII